VFSTVLKGGGGIPPTRGGIISFNKSPTPLQKRWYSY